MDVIALIHREDSAWGISFPDFPGCISAGNSLQEVLSQGREALEFHIDGLVEDGETMLPQVSVPIAKGTKPATVPDAEPADEPDEPYFKFQGFFVRPPYQ